MTPHEYDLDFMRRVRESTRDGLNSMLRFECWEAWRIVAVRREIARRDRGEAG